MNTNQELWVAPGIRLKDVPKNLTLDYKIDVFSARINGWKMDIADYLINGKIIENKKGSLKIEGNPNAGYATLDILLSYFEMIGKYQEGYIGKNYALYFENGFRSVFARAAKKNKRYQ